MFIVRSAIDLSSPEGISNQYYFTRQGVFQIHDDGSIRDSHGGALQVHVKGKLQDASLKAAVLEWSDETHYGFIGRDDGIRVYGQRRPIISRSTLASDVYVSTTGGLSYYTIPETCFGTNVGKWTSVKKQRNDNKVCSPTGQTIAIVGALLNPITARTIAGTELANCWVGETVNFNVRPPILTKQYEVLLETASYDLTPEVPKAVIVPRNTEWSWPLFSFWSRCCNTEEAEAEAQVPRASVATCKP